MIKLLKIKATPVIHQQNRNQLQLDQHRQRTIQEFIFRQLSGIQRYAVYTMSIQS